MGFKKWLVGDMELAALAAAGLFVIALAVALQGGFPASGQPVSPALAAAPQEPMKAPEFAGLSNWFNSKPLTLAGLKGKVVLLNFWAYSRINCLRALPYLKQWDEKYGDKGLVVIGVHSPEFGFEQQPENVQAAIRQLGIRYPVALDNGHATWNAYENQLWPHQYLIDKEGIIRYHHAGEGAYDETEKAIQLLLGEETPLSEPKDAQAVDFSRVLTPEIYLGTSKFMPGTEKFVGLKGKWKQNPDSIELEEAIGIVRVAFQAKSVNIVAEAPEGATLTILLDGKPVGKFQVKEPRLYPLAVAGDYGRHGAEFGISGKGFKLYTVTFG